MTHSVFAACEIAPAQQGPIKHNITSILGTKGPYDAISIQDLQGNLASEMLKFFQAIAILFGSDQNSAEKEMKDVMEFDKELAEISPTM